MWCTSFAWTLACSYSPLNFGTQCLNPNGYFCVAILAVALSFVFACVGFIYICIRIQFISKYRRIRKSIMFQIWYLAMVAHWANTAWNASDEQYKTRENSQCQKLVTRVTCPEAIRKVFGKISVGPDSVNSVRFPSPVNANSYFTDRDCNYADF